MVVERTDPTDIRRHPADMGTFRRVGIGSDLVEKVDAFFRSDQKHFVLKCESSQDATKNHSNSLGSFLRRAKPGDTHSGHHIILIVLTLDPNVFSIFCFNLYLVLLLLSLPL